MDPLIAMQDWTKHFFDRCPTSKSPALAAERPIVPDSIRTAYESGIQERHSSPDKVFWDGEEMAILDDNLVTLDSKQREHPRTWSISKRWTTTIIVGAFCFLAPFASTIFAPSIQLVMSDLHVSDPIDGSIQIGLFLLAFAVGPLFLAPMSELYGRKIVLLGGNLFFIAFSIGGGFAKTAGQLATCRFMSGLGGSSSLAIFGGVLADIWDLKARAKASGVLYLVLILGPVLGPTCGGWMSELASWRWACWVPAIAAAVLHVLAQFLMRESYVPVLLKWKLKQRKKNKMPEKSLYTVLDLQHGERRSAFMTVVVQSARPIIYLGVDPAPFLLSLYFATIFGTLYLLIVTFSSVFGEGYGDSAGIVGTDLLSQGVGSVIGMIFTVKALDMLYAYEIKPGKIYRAESRLKAGFVGAILTAGGLFMYGFSALRTNFMVPLVGLGIFAAGVVNIGLYIVDCFQYAASAIAAVSTFRCFFGGAFPLFAQRLFDSLGVDWGCALLGFISLLVGGPALPLLYIYGKHLRTIGAANFEKATGTA